MKKETFYNKRTWLNDEDSPSTGYVVAYHGLYDDEQENLFLRIGDCRGCITLHAINEDDFGDFKKKMHLLKDNLDEFVEYLDNWKETEEDE